MSPEPLLPQLKKLGVAVAPGGGGAVKVFHMSDIQNIEALLHLHYLRATTGVDDLGELFVHTSAMEYADTTAVQLGFERDGLPWISGGRDGVIDTLMKYQERGNAERIREHDQLLARYGLTRGTVVRYGFDVDFKVRVKP